MASYSSYKQITNARIVDGSIPGSAVQSGTFSNWCVKWIRGGCGIAPYGHGGQNARTTYCGNGHWGQGATGGGGLVKITYF